MCSGTLGEADDLLGVTSSAAVSERIALFPYFEDIGQPSDSAGGAGFL